MITFKENKHAPCSMLVYRRIPTNKRPKLIAFLSYHTDMEPHLSLVDGAYLTLSEAEVCLAYLRKLRNDK